MGRRCVPGAASTGIPTERSAGQRSGPEAATGLKGSGPLDHNTRVKSLIEKAIETAASPVSPVELDSRKPRQGTEPDPLQNARTVLNAFYPGSFPDPLRLPFDDEPVKTAPELAPAAEPKPRGSYNLTAAAEHLNMTRRKLRALITQKRVRCTQIDSRNFIFTQADLDEFLATYKTKPRRI
jgi:hypothetical protein